MNLKKDLYDYLNIWHKHIMELVIMYKVTVKTLNKCLKLQGYSRNNVELLPCLSFNLFFLSPKGSVGRRGFANINFQFKNVLKH